MADEESKILPHGRDVQHCDLADTFEMAYVDIVYPSSSLICFLSLFSASGVPGDDGSGPHRRLGHLTDRHHSQCGT